MFLRSLLLLHTFISLLPHVNAAPVSQWQEELGTEAPDNWQTYVRSPPTEIVHPVRLVSDQTLGNVTNPDGFLTGKGSTILTRTDESDVPPAIVVDFGQNIVGYVSISFGGAYNTTPGLPGIRLAFSETLEYLTNVSDFTRSYNVRSQYQL